MRLFTRDALPRRVGRAPLDISHGWVGVAAKHRMQMSSGLAATRAPSFTRVLGPTKNSISRLSSQSIVCSADQASRSKPGKWGDVGEAPIARPASTRRAHRAATTRLAPSTSAPVHSSAGVRASQATVGHCQPWSECIPAIVVARRSVSAKFQAEPATGRSPVPAQLLETARGRRAGASSRRGWPTPRTSSSSELRARAASCIARWNRASRWPAGHRLPGRQSDHAARGQRRLRFWDKCARARPTGDLVPTIPSSRGCRAKNRRAWRRLVLGTAAVTLELVIDLVSAAAAFSGRWSREVVAVELGEVVSHHQ